MKTARGTTVIENGQLVDGTGRPAVPDEVVSLIGAKPLRLTR